MSESTRKLGFISFILILLKIFLLIKQRENTIIEGLEQEKINDQFRFLKDRTNYYKVRFII